MEKIVKTGRTAVFTLDGTECRLTFAQKYRGFDIENRSDGDILVSFRSGSVEGDDETMTIPAGGSFNFMQMYESDTIYLTGTGKVAVAAKNDSNPNFKSSQGGGDSGTASGSVVGLQIEKYVDEQVSGGVSVSTLPYDFHRGSAVVYNGEIHILGGNDSSTSHYKFNGSSWESVSTLPYGFNNGSAVVLNGEIHILGSGYYKSSSRPYAKYHYKYNGTSWVSVSTLPYDFNGGSAVVLNGEIHILGGNDSDTSHYKFNGSSWESVSTLPYDFYRGSAVVYNGEIHILGSGYSIGGTYTYASYHYKYNGSSWESVSTLPYNFTDGSAVVLNGEIHILGGSYYDGGVYPYAKKYYKFNGSSWIDVCALPYEFYSGSAAVLNDAIHILGGSNSSRRTNHYLVGLDSRHIAAMLPKGVHILLSDNEDIVYASNAKIISSSIAEVTNTGYVELLAALTDADNTKGYLTFY